MRVSRVRGGDKSDKLPRGIPDGLLLDSEIVAHKIAVELLAGAKIIQYVLLLAGECRSAGRRPFYDRIQRFRVHSVVGYDGGYSAVGGDLVGVERSQQVKICHAAHIKAGVDTRPLLYAVRWL